MQNKALVVGSVAYDVVFEVHNTLRDEIVVKDGKPVSVSMMLTASNRKVFFGGTGGNIAYGLGVQGESPLLFSVVGDDFNSDYKRHLTDRGVDLRLVVKEGEFTSTFYAISDKIKEQLGIFQPNTHGDYMHSIKLSDSLSEEDFRSIKVAIFSPGTGESIKNHMTELRKRVGDKVKIIFDPSQILSIFFTKEMLLECIKMSDIFIGNETEIAQLQEMLGLTVKEILKMGLECIIETKGKDGAVIHALNNETSIKAVATNNFIEQTGAGDAFRAGLIKGLLNDLSVEEACVIASQVASLSVESEGGQNYKVPN